VAVRGRQVQRVRDLRYRTRRQVPVLLLREPKRRQHSRARPLGVARTHFLNGLVQAQRSTSPITESSEPTMAIMSATYALLMHVAVASSATNDGARNFTRHGLDPPSDTT